MNSVYDTSNFITAELDKLAVKHAHWHTGGGCTAIKIELPGLGTDGEDAVIVITNHDSSVDLTPDEQATFTGWMAAFFPTEDDEMYGENMTIVHGHYGAEAPQPVIDWREDTKVMATSVANFIAELRK